MTTPPPPPPEAALPTTPPRPSYHIRPVPARATYALRHAVLWPDRPPAYVRLDADADGWHFGAFPGPEPQQAGEAGEGEEEPVSVLSLFLDDGLLHPPADADADADAPRTTTYYRFRKFATAAAWQGRGAGSALLRHVMVLAAARQPEHRHGGVDDGDSNRGGGGGDDEDADGKRRGMGDRMEKQSPSHGGVVIWCDARQSALPFYARFGFAAAGDVFYKGDVPYLQMSRRLV